MYIREDQADIRVWINGIPYPTTGDSWRTAEGANLVADDAKTRPGGMGREVSAGGPASREDLTVTTQFTDVIATLHPVMESLVGTGDVKVGISWMRPDRRSSGQGQTIRGTLKQASAPDHGDGSDVAMYTIVVSCHEQSN
jgi:hypothetical protein